MKRRRRHNYFENRHNQFETAGKIAVKTGAINPYNSKGYVLSIYRLNNGKISYSLVGQAYLRQLDITAIEL